MTKPKRCKDVKACPNADRWLREHPDAALNLRRIVKFLDDRYEGGYQGYINRAKGFVEYRFDPVKGDPHIKHVQLFARQKHVIVRFTAFAKRMKNRIGISKTLKRGSRNSYVLEFPITVNTSLDELEEFLRTTITFSRTRTVSATDDSAERGSYKASPSADRRTLREAIERAERGADQELSEPIISEGDARERGLRAVFLRRGQGKFRKALLKAYEKRCAVTDCSIEEILEAAHIIPYKVCNMNRCNNGLLLRADIHTLFDLGLLWINQERKVEIAKSLQHTEYGTLQGTVIRLPMDTVSQPRLDHLARHAQIARELRAARSRCNDRNRSFKGAMEARAIGYF